MTPTNELRFVEREVLGFHNQTIRVLQQKWIDPPQMLQGVDDWMWVGGKEEWRDIPCVKEKASAN